MSRDSSIVDVVVPGGIESFGLPVLGSLKEYPFVRLKNRLLPYPLVKKKGVLPLEEQEDGRILVALSDPLDFEASEEIRQALGKEIVEAVTTPAFLEEGIESCYHSDSDASDLIAGLQTDKEPIRGEDLEGYDLLDQKGDSPVVRILNAILLEAITQGVSDIHFDPSEFGLGVRYRIDGVLQMRHSPPEEYCKQLVTRIKVLARLDIAEQRLPQDGRIKLRVGGRSIDFRVSTVPCVFGERVVLRILDKSNVLLGLSKLGMDPSVLQNFQRMISLPEGIVLVTGPTGSGKTTTLYSALSELNSSKVNIMTIEDPVEYKLQGMAQIGVNPKIDLTFARGLRHILRQDPDIIMIGEIRDKETAEIAIQASLTGHLVLSTLHTNDAPSALTRLIDMGIEAYLLTSSVTAVLAQRLVRTLCPFCKVPAVLSKEERALLQIDLASEGNCFAAKGCPSCFGSGYKGRHGIYELMELTGPLKRRLIASPDAGALQELALRLGMSSLRREGAKLVLSGITSVEEVFRVTRGIEGAE